ncbi:pre-peptidase C-terminal domain-containing protein [Ramlibacter albus]|uniref:Pre-peptidase C-terminal domain-containing protein n=1 Tax=Ramlibacter albus TaxID=2079448 RepID=A0A923M7Q4_9BURK|nr:pre-peptidase C-terminal domain-containing protein [Ramlibacter albus]MBC5764319.1 pre-peptidase C-terminal domain-containing protein [Ramlibacter albus]
MADDYSFDTSTTGSIVANTRIGGGTIEVPGDKDMFSVSLTAGTTYTFNLVRFGVSWLNDPYLQLYNPQLTLVAQDDDSGNNLQARIVYTPTTSGTYYLGVMDAASGTGQYQIGATSSTSITGSVSLGALRTQVSEGDSVTFIVSAPISLAGNTYGYVLQGVSATDITSTTMNGQFTIGSDGRARITTTLVNDNLTEGTETLTIGTDIGQNLSVTVLDTSRPMVNVSATARNVLGVYSAFYGNAPTSATYATELGVYNSGGSSNYAADVAARFATTPNQSLAGTVLANLGVTAATTGGYTPSDSFTLVRDALTVYFTAFPSAKGQVVLNLVNLLANLERDTVWGQAAINFNNTLAARYSALPVLADTPAELVGVAHAGFDA